ncbi:ADP-ribosylglycohydrolase family protein [uncultured Dechloromonas sp.]|uniref:ADP-ribosylglycohydrolase family protein n=1 Tax=uncultured Dechloromonas sp. TaxID=171719 RepID=UPI0025CC9460|nr:ADP-ribosylglycohydrolase family protein [uncultured Dechloromonas sp.]
MNPVTPICLSEKLRGCLLGGAVGDALGAPVEFLSLAEIKATFGAEGIQNYAPAFGRLGAITDDTQMTLFTAEGLLCSYVRGALRGIASPASVVSHAYLRWLWTQGMESKKPKPERVIGLLWGVKELHSQRAPGLTCVSALKAMTQFTDSRASNDSKGAGGVMRVAPVAMMFAGEPENASQAFSLGMQSAALTHGHPTGFLAAGAFAVILHAIFCDENINVGIDRAKQYLAKQDAHEETLSSIEKGVALAGTDLRPDDAIRNIGEGWVAEEALGIAIYCALKAVDFRHGVLIAVNHDGDSDTTGSMVGQLLGATYGISGIPYDWLSPLELREIIEQVADDITDHWSWNLDYMSEAYDEAVVKRYPGG